MSKILRLSIARVLFAGFALVCIPGCKAGSETEQEKANPSKHQWRRLADGSFAYNMDLAKVYKTPGSVALWRRCWQVEHGLDCILVMGTSEAGTISRWQMPSLPVDEDPQMGKPSGDYGCDYLTGQMTIIENAFGPNGAKRDNVISIGGSLPNSRPWSKAQAVQSLEQVGSTQSGAHFDCVEIASQIIAKGIQALESPALTRRILQ